MQTKTAAYILLIVFTLLGVVCSQTSTTQGNFKVSWTMFKDEITHKEYIVEVQNLVSSEQQFNLSLVVNGTGYDASRTSNLQVYEWKSLPTIIPAYIEEKVTQVFDYPSDMGNFTYSPGCWNTGSLLNYSCNVSVIIQSGTTTINQCGWKSSKSLLFSSSSSSIKSGYGSILIPKYGSKVKTDDYGVVETVNGIKRFKVVFDTPILFDGKAWGSSGMVGVEDEFTDYFYHPWWNSSWNRRVPIEVVTTYNHTNYQVLLNITYDADMRSGFGDIRATDKNGVSVPYWIQTQLNSTWVYMFVLLNITNANGTQGYIYYGNPTATTTSDCNTTMELCHVSQLTEVDADGYILRDSNLNQVNFTNMPRNKVAYTYKETMDNNISEFIYDFDVYLTQTRDFGWVGVSDTLNSLNNWANGNSYEESGGIPAQSKLKGRIGGILTEDADIILKSNSVWYYFRFRRYHGATYLQNFSSAEDRYSNWTSSTEISMTSGLSTKDLDYLYAVISYSSSDGSTATGIVRNPVVRKFSNGTLSAVVTIEESSNTAPQTPVIANISNHTNTSNITDNTPDVYFNVTDLDNSTLSCTLFVNSSGKFGTNSSVLNNTMTVISVNVSLADGVYNLSVNCSDGEGLSNISEEWRETIDTTPPSITNYFPANGGAIPWGSPGAVNFTSYVSDVTLGIFNSSLFINTTYNLSNTSLTNNVNYSYSQNFSLGWYSWYVQACDPVFLCGNSTTWYFSMTNVTTTTTTTTTLIEWTGINEDQEMILPVWLMLIIVSLSFSLGAYFLPSPKNIIPTLVAGVFWIICGVTSSNVGEIIVFGSYDYIREFSFPYLIIFLGLIGVGHLIVAGGTVLKLVGESVDIRDGTLKESDDYGY